MENQSNSKGGGAIVAGVAAFLLGGMQYYFGRVCGESECYFKEERPALFLISQFISYGFGIFFIAWGFLKMRRGNR